MDVQTDPEKSETKLTEDFLNENFELLYHTLEDAKQHFETGYKLCQQVLDTVTTAGIFKKENMKELLKAMEEKSQKIRTDALEGKIEFDEIREEISLSNYKELIDSDKIERLYKVEQTAIHNDIQRKYNNIIKVATELNIPEISLIVKCDVNAGTWTVINKENNSVVCTGKV